MRKAFVVLTTAAFALGAFGATGMVSTAQAAKTAKGCIIGKEKWNAVEAKCEAAKPVKKAAKSVAKKT